MDSRERRYRKFDAIAKKAKIEALEECLKLCKVIEAAHGTASDLRRLIEIELMSEAR